MSRAFKFILRDEKTGTEILTYHVLAADSFEAIKKVSEYVKSLEVSGAAPAAS